MTVVDVADDLTLVSLDQPLLGFRSFVGSWIIRGDRTYLIDPGPASTISHLVETLAACGIFRLDAVLLTHLHIDHAGGTGRLLQHYPRTPVYCHASGCRHLADPGRLWEGSLKTLGDTARAYGTIEPVDADRLHDAAAECPPGVDVIATPGHAAHHVSYRFGRSLFAGEACGVYRLLADGNVYLRPATPPRFFLETSLESLDRLLAVDHDRLCFGHFGWSGDTPELLGQHRAQLLLWRDIIGQLWEVDAGEGLIERCIERLCGEDRLLAGLRRMSADDRHRERGFLTNSVRGFIGYLERLTEKQ